MRWLLFGNEFDQRIGKPKLCIGIFSFGCITWIADECIVCTKDESKRIEQKNFFIIGHAAKVSRLQSYPNYRCLNFYKQQKPRFFNVGYM